MNGWAVTQIQPGDRSCHVFPVDDLMIHEASDGCPCGPTLQPVPCPDGMLGMVLLHHALDGRREYLNEVTGT